MTWSTNLMVDQLDGYPLDGHRVQQKLEGKLESKLESQTGKQNEKRCLKTNRLFKWLIKMRSRGSSNPRETFGKLFSKRSV